MRGKVPARIILVFGFALYFLNHGSVILIPIFKRAVPVEADDAYAYIAKAAQMRSCFRQDCRALEDLRSHITVPAATPDLAWARAREYGLSFYIYHPLHSAVLLVLHEIGVSWEAAYNTAAGAGMFLIGLAMGYWLSVMWGPGPAGLALALMAFQVFPPQGLHMIVPSNMTLGLAFLAWGLVLRRRTGAPWAVLAPIPLMIAIHPMGKLYSLVSIFLYWRVAPRPFPGRSWWVLAAGFLLVAVSFILPYFIARPALLLGEYPYPEGWNYWSGVGYNISAAGWSIEKWIRAHGGIPVVAFLLPIGVMAMSPPRRRDTLAMLSSLFVLSLGSVFHVFPRYPAEMFGRIWIADVALLSGVVGQTAWAWGGAAVSGFRRRAGEEEHAAGSGSGFILGSGGWKRVLAAALGLVLFHTVSLKVFLGEHELRATVSDLTERQRIALHPGQPLKALDDREGCGAIFYESEELMHFFFSRGGLGCGAVYYPALRASPEWKTWVEENEKIRHFVLWNPIRSVRDREGGIPLEGRTFLEVEGIPPESFSGLSLYIENPGKEKTLRLHTAGVDSSDWINVFEAGIPRTWSGWAQPFGEQRLFAPKVGLEVIGAGPIILKGVRLHPDDATRWPWGKGITLAYRTAKEPGASKKISFDPRSMLGRLGVERERPVLVLDDEGSSVLLRIGP